MSLMNAITGHDRPKHILLGSLATSRVATTYLFAGESGIGKRLTAIEFARAVNCLDPVTVSDRGRDGARAEGLDACDRCSSCRKFSSLVHPDLKLVEPEGGVIRIDAVREIQEFLSFAPYEGRKKVVVMDDAECMNQAASNAFLKTLEEPPPDSLIILVTAAPERLLDTIRSRCFVVRFSPLSTDACREVIAGRLSGIDAAELESLAVFSMGRPGVAIQGEGMLLRDTVGAMVGDILRGGLSVQWKDRAEMEQWCSLFLTVLRDVMVMKISPDAGDLLINRWLEDEMSAVGRAMELEALLRLYTELTALMEHFRFNLNMSIVSNYIKSLFAAAVQYNR
ncbi:MAG TPA: DNA polymerase III subunit delta' [Nitrospirae bacterium]|nr:DNA polymerase III subunit delta' [Nitrospirota bacterium]